MAVDFSQFRQVGEFNNLGQQRLPRSMKSPIDKCTIVSILTNHQSKVLIIL